MVRATHPGAWESGRLPDLTLQRKSNLISKRFGKMLVTDTGKPEGAFLDNDIFADLNLLC